MTEQTGALSRRSFLTTATAAAGAATFGAPWVARAVGAKYTLRIATLAPQDSSWMRTFRAVGREIKQATGGEVALKLYAGGVMGDEGAMVRKMRTGQLDGAAVTNVGLGDINKQLLMLQLPLLFRNYKELDRVRNAMADTFAKLLYDSGFLLMGWGDVGPLYLFSNSPIARPADIRATKMWVWDADPVSRTVMKVAGVNAIPLSVPDVLPSLQTGVVDAFANSPYGAIALQWYTKAKYVTNLKLAMVIGGSVITRKAWEQLPPAHQAVMKQIADKHHGKLLRRIRADNDAAVKTLTAKGISVVQPKAFGEWKAIANKVRAEMTGSFFDPALVNKMLSLL